MLRGHLNSLKTDLGEIFLMLSRLYKREKNTHLPQEKKIQLIIEHSLIDLSDTLLTTCKMPPVLVYV